MLPRDSSGEKDRMPLSVQPSNVGESDTVCSNSSKFFLTDILIELSPEDPEHISPIVEIFDSQHENGDTLLLEKVSSRKWRHLSPIELADEITFMARWDTTGDFGYIHLTSAELEGPRKQGASINRFRRQFAVDADNVTLTMSYGFCVVPPGKYVLLEDENDLLPREVTLASFTEQSKLVFAFAFALPDDAPQKPELLNLCGDWYLQRFKSTKAEDDVSKAIKAYEFAAQLVPEDDSRLGGFLYSVGASYLGRYQEFGVFRDINEAVCSIEAAVNIVPDSYAGKQDRLNDLGNALQYRFRRTGQLTDISDAILAHQKATTLAPCGHGNLPIMLRNLGNSFMSRFQSTGNLSDISEAISTHQKAVHFTQDGDVKMVGHLTSLGVAYTLRFMFEHKGDIADISAAISAHRKAINLSPKGHETLPNMLNNVALSLVFRYDRTRNIADLSEAIKAQQEAVNLTPGGHPDRPAWMNSLGNIFLRRFECRTNSEDLADISRAIALQQKAIELTPDGHANILSYSSSLGNSFRSRCRSTKDAQDMLDAISAHQRALDLIPEGHPDKASLLAELGKSFFVRFEHTADPTDIEKSISNYRLGSTSSSGIPSVRFEAARIWCGLCRKYDPSQALDAYAVVIELVSRIAGVEQTIQKRHEKLADISDLSVSAAAAAFSAGRYETALEWLEQGRCIVWSQINALRSPIDELRMYDEPLANRLYHLSRSLENAGTRADGLGTIGTDASMGRRISLQDEVTAHVKLAQEWDELVKQVRDIPRFRNFLRPQPCSELLNDIPESGPVVVVNVHKDRCDALALIAGADTPLHIPLENFSSRQAENLRRLLHLYLSSHGVRMRGDTKPNIDDADPTIRAIKLGTIKSGHDSAIHEVLHDLWVYVVKPILDGLAISRPSTDPSRIWWCATGPLSFLPIHGAGLYGRKKNTAGPCLSDFAISSYTPTVGALLERTKKSQNIKADQNLSGLVMVSQPNTPLLPSIPGTTREIRAIEQVLKGTKHSVLCLEGDVASKSRVIKEMETHPWIHFACHAIQETSNPLESGFYLYDKRLDLAEIIQKRLPTAEFAFLSACQTSTGDEKLSEEAVHLAGGMLAAGYQGVVATMWSIQDRHGPKIAGDFYTSVLSRGTPDEGEGLKSGAAAHALHYAIQQIRKTLGDSEGSLLVWVPYVHMGV
ncbi:CHAT domain-containing protein [Flammula alnicola]|nr:CHAT domain-containing protein [Flammula alnicola]